MPSRPAAAYRCTAELDYQFKTEILVNEPHMTAIARAAAEKLVPPEKIFPFQRNMGGEDFAEYTSHIPCAFVALAEAATPRSTATCSASTRAPWRPGSALYAQVAVDYLNG